MFRSPIETELLARDRMETLAATYASGRKRSGRRPGHPVLNRARHGLGRGLISLGEQLDGGPRPAEGRGQPPARVLSAKS